MTSTLAPKTGSTRWATFRSSANWTRSHCKAGAPAIAPDFTLELMAKHSLDFWLTSEDLPDPNNRVTLDRDGKIVLSYTRRTIWRPTKRLQAKLKQAMKQTNCAMHGHDCHQGLFSRSLYVGQRIPLAGVAHQNGTIRFGHDPKTSALDANCKAHDVDNLYVVDGSFFPSSAAVNPALTIMANALRVGDHLLERLGVSRETDQDCNPNGVNPAAEVRSGLKRNRGSWNSVSVRQLLISVTIACTRLSVLRQSADCLGACCFRQPRPSAQLWWKRVDAIGITVSDMDRSVEFYSKVLTFEKVSDIEVAGDELRTSRRCVRPAHARRANAARR